MVDTKRSAEANALLAAEWSIEEFGGAELGDKRLSQRLVGMSERVFARPSGRITDVFDDPAERQAAYDFVSNPRVCCGKIRFSMATAMLKRCQEEPFVFVPTDGTCLSLTDRALLKDFGTVGGRSAKSRGIKVVSAIGVDSGGAPLGIAAMTYWARKDKPTRSKRLRSVQEKELKYWISTFQQTVEHFNASGTSCRAWFQVDREGDAGPYLQHLSTNGHFFTVRGSWNRRIRHTGSKPLYLRDVLSAEKPLGNYSLLVAEGPGRSKRIARMSIGATRVTLDLTDQRSGKRSPLETNVVWVREISDVPPGETPLEWILLTNYKIEHLEDACLVVYGYTQRWRIEEFHRTWKQGSCNVESTQLHTSEHVERWATLLASVAMRIERLKYLSRNQPDLPATEVLAPYEIKALILLKRRKKKKTETVPHGVPTIGQATRWIADLGGYTGKSSGGPPGAVTIRRGLEKVMTVAEVLQGLDQEGLLKMG